MATLMKYEDEPRPASAGGQPSCAPPRMGISSALAQGSSPCPCWTPMPSLPPVLQRAESLAPLSSSGCWGCPCLRLGSGWGCHRVQVQLLPAPEAGPPAAPCGSLPSCGTPWLCPEHGRPSPAHTQHLLQRRRCLVLPP